MQNIWIGTDWHLWSSNHNGAHPYRTKKSIENLIHNYADTVEEDDILLILGDITDPAATDFKQLQDMIRSIPGTKILCRGNHDTETDDWYYTLGFRYVCEVCTCHQFVFSHKPIIVDKGLINIHADLHFGKVINNGYQHINAYAALHQSNPDAPILLEDLLDTATMDNDDLNDIDHMPPKMTQATMLWTNEKYNNIIDITDMVSLSPVDESSMPVIVSLSADIEEDEDDMSLNEVLFRDVESTKYFEADDDSYDSDINRSKYADSKVIKNVHKNDVAADGESTTMDEAAKNRINDKGEEVPEICPKCGSKVGVFLRGEPVYLCTNKKCEKYFGTVPFKNESVSWRDHYENHSLIWSTLYPYDADHLKCSLMNYMHEAYGCDQVNIQCYSGKDFRDELGLPRSYTSYGDEDTLVVMETTGLSASVINQIKNDTDARYVTDMIDNHVRIMETSLSEYHGPEYINQSNIDIAWKYIYENSLDPSVFVGMILDEMAYEDYCDHYYAELKRIVAKYNKDASIKKKMAKICEVDEKDIPDFECHIAVSGEKQLAFTILTEDVDETIRINMERYLNAMCKELAKTSKEYPATGTIWTADGDGVIYIDLKFDSIVESVLSNYIKDKAVAFDNFRANAMYTGKWDIIQNSFTKLIQNADTMERINYLRRDARYGITSMEKLLDKMEKVQRGEMTNKYVENCMKGGNTPDKLKEHVKWLRTKALPILTERAKEIRSKSKSMNETSSSIPSLYFISTDPSMDGKTLIPRIPDNFLTKNGYEDTTTKRVCFSTSVDGCLRALSQNCTNKEFSVYTPVLSKTHKVIKPTVNQVPDVNITQERWITTPVKLQYIGKIKVTGDTGEDGIQYTYGDKKQYTAELYNWNWEWIEKENNLNESTVMHQETYYYLSYENKHDELYPVGKCLFRNLEDAVEEVVFKSKNKHPMNKIKIPCDMYIHTTEPGYYELRSSDMNFNAYWSQDQITLRCIGQVHINADGTFNQTLDETNTKGSHQVVYHGSPHKMSKIDPKNNSYEDNDYVFGTPDRNFALCYAGNPWNDFIINQSYINGELTLIEIKPNAFKKTFNRSGYIYTLPAEDFNIVRSSHEIMSDHSVTPISVEYIDNIYKELQKSGIKLYHYGSWPKNHRFKTREEYITDREERFGSPIQESYQFELIDDVTFDDQINETTTANERLYPVYVVLVHSGTIISRAIKAVSHSEFSHASISFDSSLKKMYSFARKDPSNFLIGGFRYETIGEGFYKNKEIPYAVYCVPCTKSQIDAMKKRLNYFIRNESKFTFDFAGLVKNYLGIVDNPEYSWFCSRFVADILNAGAPSGKLYVNEPSLQDPDDFMQMEEAIYVTGGMNLMKYDKSLADKRTKVILAMAQRGKINRDKYRNEPITESATKRIGKRGIPTYEKPAGMIAYDMSRDEAEQIAQKYGIHTSKSKDDHSEFSDKYEDPEKKKERLKEEKRLALERARRQKAKLERRKKLRSKLPWAKNESYYKNLHETDTSVDDSDVAHYDSDTVENDDLRGKRKEIFPNREMPQEDIDKPIITPKNESFRFLSKMTESDINTEDGHDPTAIYVMFGTDGIRISFTPDLTQYYQIKHTHDDIYRVEHVFRNLKDIETGKIVALSYIKPIIDTIESKLDWLSKSNTPIRFAVPITKINPNITSRLIMDIFQIGQINVEEIKPITESVHDYTGIDDSIRLKRNMKILRGYSMLESTTGVYDMNQNDPYLNETLDHIFACINENAIGSVINYMKSFKLHFDQDGNIIIHRREYDKLRMHFNTSLRMIKAYEKAGNIVGVKDELTRIHYMIQLIDQYFISTPVSNRSTMKAKDMIDLRSVMINVFSQHLKWVTVQEPDFNFNTYYDGTVYSKSLTIPHGVIHALGKTFVTLLT